MTTITAPAPSGTGVPTASRAGGHRRARVLPVLLGGGVLSPLLSLASGVLASVRYAGNSPLDQTICELNAIGVPTGALTVASGIAVDALLVAFGVGICRSATASRRLRAAGGDPPPTRGRVSRNRRFPCSSRPGGGVPRRVRR